METIRKPLRHAVESTRSRGRKKSDDRQDRQRSPANARVSDFAAMVGIRRDEYQGLRGRDYVRDESNYPCVLVRKGKGGKLQKQRLLPDDIAAVRPYFDGGDAYVFSKAELTNKLDLHYLRAQQAQRAYAYYCRRLGTEPGYRRQLMAEIRRRWQVYNRKRWSPACVEGQIWLRGHNRAFAQAHGLPIVYDRLAVMAVSVFHLSHWRANVAISHYLLAFSDGI